MANSAPTTATSGFTASYTDPNSGAVYANAWVQLRLISYAPNTSVQVGADVYVDQAAYQSGMQAVAYNILSVVDFGSDDWNTYFDVSVLAQADHDIQSQSLAFAQSKV